jgi:hypothetical protein
VQVWALQALPGAYKRQARARKRLDDESG